MKLKTQSLLTIEQLIQLIQNLPEKDKQILYWFTEEIKAKAELNVD